MVRNTYIYRPSRRCGSSPTSSPTLRARMPKFNSISISAITSRKPEARTRQLELAFTLADGLEYVRPLASRAAGRRRLRRRSAFFFGIGMNFFMEIAKLRAARRCWGGSCRPSRQERKPLMLRTHCQTSGLVADRAGPVQQRRPHDDRGDGRGVRRHAVAAHQRASTRRRAAHRFRSRASPATRRCPAGGDASRA